MKLPLIVSLLEIKSSGKRDEDFGNMDGWESGVELTWPEAEVTRDNKTMILHAHVGKRCVGTWDIKANKGYVELED